MLSEANRDYPFLSCLRLPAKGKNLLFDELLIKRPTRFPTGVCLLFRYQQSPQFSKLAGNTVSVNKILLFEGFSFFGKQLNIPHCQNTRKLLSEVPKSFYIVCNGFNGAFRFKLKGDSSLRVCRCRSKNNYETCWKIFSCEINFLWAFQFPFSALFATVSFSSASFVNENEPRAVAEFASHFRSCLGWENVLLAQLTVKSSGVNWMDCRRTLCFRRFRITMSSKGWVYPDWIMNAWWSFAKFKQHAASCTLEDFVKNIVVVYH